MPLNRNSTTILPVRAWRAWNQRGPGYVWHKTLRRTLAHWPALKRRLVYDDPRSYWTLRGGPEYFEEQEGQPARTRKAEWIASRVATYEPTSILEVGCGYGKLLRALRCRIDVPLVGVDFSASQLELGRRHLAGLPSVELAWAEGDRLPFADHAFDLVITSAVILHNPPLVAERIRREIIRVAKRYTAHNEDMDISYNRYGYDTAAWYRDRGYIVLESGGFPSDCVSDPTIPTQFCVAKPWLSS